MYSSALGSREHIPLPELVEMLTDLSSPPSPRERSTLRDVSFTPELLELMRLSLHPPHLVDERPHETLQRVEQGRYETIRATFTGTDW